MAEQRRNEVARSQGEADKERARAQGEADAKLTLATADAKAIEIRAQALRSNPDVVTLNAVEKWDGKLPTYMASGSRFPSSASASSPSPRRQRWRHWRKNMTTKAKTKKQGTALILRTCSADLTSHGGFQWPDKIGAVVEAPDWKKDNRCGHGLHGWLFGQGDHVCSSTVGDADAKWLVVEVVIADLIAPRRQGEISSLHSPSHRGQGKRNTVPDRKRTTRGRSCSDRRHPTGRR
ncbi:hypothetical protein P4133_10850 [Pseudomonas aeruginosa]|nr:hypothetical protein [Pseudomonas aeruginosa]